MDAEELCGVAEAAMGPLEGPGDEHFLELAARVVEVHAAFEHLLDEVVELLAHESY